MKDLTTTSFGLVIAYLLPGLAGLYGLSFWFPAIATTFSAFLTAESNVGLFLIVVLASLTLGMVVHGIRWIVFEVWCSRARHRLEPSLFANLSGERKLTAFRTAVDEIYRYHQWWGGIAIVAPVVCSGWILSPNTAIYGPAQKAVLWSIAAALEVLLVFAAWRVWTFYVTRLTWILKGGDNTMSGVGVPLPAPAPEPEPTIEPAEASSTAPQGGSGTAKPDAGRFQ